MCNFVERECVFVGAYLCLKSFWFSECVFYVCSSVCLCLQKFFESN